MMKKILLLFALLYANLAFCCTTIIVGADASANGRPLLWKQRDSSVRFNYLDFFNDEGCFSFTGVVDTNDTLRASVWCGTNEVGFSIMNSVAYGLSPIIDDNRPWEGIIMKKALQICTTIDDFQHYIDTLPQPNGLEANFGVSDANGDAAYFEVHDFGYTRFDVPRDGYLIRTNYAFTGREGEGKGYDRYKLVEQKMKAHKGKFDAEWIYEELAMQPIIARPTSVASVVLDGQVLWCETGYSRACYPIPVWVAAGNEIPVPLRKINAQGSEASEIAYTLNIRYRGKRLAKKIDKVVRRMMKLELEAFRDFDGESDDFGIDIAVVKRYNASVADRFETFKRDCAPYLR